LTGGRSVLGLVDQTTHPSGLTDKKNSIYDTRWSRKKTDARIGRPEALKTKRGRKRSGRREKEKKGTLAASFGKRLEKTAEKRRIRTLILFTDRGEEHVCMIPGGNSSAGGSEGSCLNTEKAGGTNSESTPKL